MAYVVQSALGGHQIPIDSGTMAVLRILDLVTDKDAAAGVVPGLERAVSKSKGIEFGSLLHQLGAEYTANPYSPAIREILLQIEPSAQERFPHRRLSREMPKEESAAAAKTAPAAKPAAEKSPPAPAAPDGGGRRKPGKDQGHLPGAAEAAADPAAGTGKASPRNRRGTAAAGTPPAELPKKTSSPEGLSKRKPR